MNSNLTDHGLPLVSLKEQRRDLVVSLAGTNGTIAKETVAEIAALQTAVTAVEAVIIDLDDEASSAIGDNDLRDGISN
ncbi:MAG: hypothetical protein ABWY64_12445 [Tardiphaga sp.]